jgi:hypothetical protein
MKIIDNIIVESSKARVAQSVVEIRDVLGVRVSDNLTNSRLSVICEGENDSSSLTALLCDAKPDLKTHFENGEISFTCLGGGGNLAYSAASIQNSICEPICFLDDDKSGIEAFETAVRDGLLDDKDAVFAKRLGKEESEFEDLILDSIVNNYLHKEYKVDCSLIPAGLRKKKFSVRVGAAFEKSGRPWNDRVKGAVKSQLNKLCAENGMSVIDPDRRGPIDALASLILDRLQGE